MSNAAIAFGLGTVFGGSCIAVIMNVLHKAWINRLHVHREYEAVSNELEIRRVAYDSEVDQDRDPGGLFETRPGAMQLAHLATRLPENRWKNFDTGQLSGTINNERVTDQEMKTDEQDTK